MSLDFLPCSVDVLRQSGDLKHRLLVPRRGDDVSVGLLLNAFDGRALGPDDQTHDPVGHSNLNGGLARSVSHELAERQGGVDVVLPRSPDLREVISSRQDFPFRSGDIFLATCHDEDRFFAPDRGLDVRVGLSSQCLDFAA